MCRRVKRVSICPTCNKKLGESTNEGWCRDARRKGHLGRCSTGVLKTEEQVEAEECEACAEIREQAMNKLDMSAFAEKRLGWQTTKGKDKDKAGGDGMLDDSDGDNTYGW